MFNRNRQAFIRFIIALILLAVVLGVLVFLLRYPIPSGNRDVVITLLGVIAGSLSTAINFYFGDSEGKDEKDI